MNYMLDTNIVSYLIKQDTAVKKKLVSKPMTSLVISSITEAELHYGLAKRPEAKKLHQLVHEFLIRITVLPWNSETAKTYGTLRASINQTGKSLAPLDLLIAAHALQTKSILVTNDQAFHQIKTLKTEDWSKQA
jgi:tRNA(fMet)-specific endonuclease VapC